MIFITLGSQKFQFNRLLTETDRLIETGVITDEVFAQIGYSDYQPRHFEYKQFLDRDEFAEMQSKADVEITHAGTGAIIGAVKKGKKVIAVPRLAEYGEHVDDHQLQLLEQFDELGLICSCKDCSELEEALKTIGERQFNSYESNTEKYILELDRYIASI